MFSTRRLAVRALSVGCLGAAVVLGAFAAPTQSTEPQSSAVADRPHARSVPTVPAVASAATERQVERQPETTVIDPQLATEPVAAAEHAALPAEPDHLAPVADDTPAPAAVVTTTTTVAPPPTTTAAPTPVATVAFSASQAYGSCGEAVPYDIFSGTATPGSTISISSPHGSGSTTADASGHWSATVEFPSAPRGEAFTVTATGLGGSKTFGFTATGAPHA